MIQLMETLWFLSSSGPGLQTKGLVWPLRFSHSSIII